MVRHALRGGVIDGLYFYPKTVQDRAIETGLTTKEAMRRKQKIFMTEFYIAIKLRSLLAKYGYKRRSAQLIQRIERCIEFYCLQATLRGGEACDIKTAGLDRMLTFRIVWPS